MKMDVFMTQTDLGLNFDIIPRCACSSSPAFHYGLALRIQKKGNITEMYSTQEQLNRHLSLFHFPFIFKVSPGSTANTENYFKVLYEMKTYADVIFPSLSYCGVNIY